MTTLRKISTFVALGVALGVAFRLARIAFRQHADIPGLQAQVELARQHVAQLRREHAEATQRWETLQAPLARARAQTMADAAMESEIRKRFARVNRLKKLVAGHPTLGLPEFQLLDEDAWLEVATQNHTFESDDEVPTGFSPAEFHETMLAENMKSALFDLRLQARMKLAERMQPALRLYLEKNQGVLPASVGDLAPFFDSPLDSAIIARYEMLHTGRLDDLPHEAVSSIGEFEPGTSLFGAHQSASGRDDSIPREAETAAVIGEKDEGLFASESRLRLGRDSFAIQGDFEFNFPGLGEAINRASLSFMTTAGAAGEPVTVDKLIPYFNPPLDAETRRRLEQFAGEQMRRKERNPFPDLTP